MGLGLAISHHLIRLHSGQITAGNRPQGGAVFTVRLPVAGSPLEGSQPAGLDNLRDRH